MKRFYREVSIGPERAILLDGRPVRTPARAPLVLPGDALADAVAAEWTAQGEEIAPRSMPLTGLANAAIDRVSADPAAFAAGLAKYAEGDLTCYRADGPDSLVEAEAEVWDPLLDWAARRYDIRFEVTVGVVHAPQPARTVARLADAVAARDAFALAGLSPLVTLSGSLVIGLAVAEGAVSPADGFTAAMADEAWQAARWGEDSLATQAREGRRTDFLAAARFLDLLG